MDLAIADYNEAIRLDPKGAVNLCNRGRVKLKINDASGNVDIRKAKELDPSVCRWGAGWSDGSTRAIPSGILREDFANRTVVRADWNPAASSWRMPPSRFRADTLLPCSPRSRSPFVSQITNAATTLTVPCRIHVAWSRREPMAAIEIARENNATCATWKWALASARKFEKGQLNQD